MTRLGVQRVSIPDCEGWIERECYYWGGGHYRGRAEGAEDRSWESIQGKCLPEAAKHVRE
jgi:hypothetical protein